MSVDPRFPIGRYEKPDEISAEQIGAWIQQIEEAPARLRAAVDGLSEVQLDTPYREGGWTIRQVVHHVPDSHLNAYVRHHLAVTEDVPTVKTYEEQLWAELPDVVRAPIGPSLELLSALHVRWVAFLRALPEDAFARAFRHPDLGLVTLAQNLGLYAWHGRHHVAHIQQVGLKPEPS